MRICIFTLFIWSVLFCPTTEAGFEDVGVGARVMAMGGAFVGLADYADAIFVNPGGLGKISNFEVALFYARPFGLHELAYGTVSMVRPFKWGRVGLACQTYGNPAYRENTIIISYGNSTQTTLSYGVNLRYMQLHIEGYGTDRTVGLDVGLLVQLSSRLNWGFFSRNVNRPRLGNERERLPQIYCSGISGRPAKNLILNLDFYKDVYFPTEWRFGVEYQILEHLSLRAGTATNPSRFTAGVGIYLNRLEFDYAFSTHSDLGLTHHVSIVISIDKSRAPES